MFRAVHGYDVATIKGYRQESRNIEYWPPKGSPLAFKIAAFSDLHNVAVALVKRILERSAQVSI